MAAKIFQFPSQGERKPGDIEKRIRASLTGLSNDPRLIEHVTARMLLYIKNYTLKVFEPSFTLPVKPLSQEQARAFQAALDDGISSIAGQVQDMVRQIIIERLFLEIELYEKTVGISNDYEFTNFLGIIDSLPEEYRSKVNYIYGLLAGENLKPQEKYLLNKLLQAIIKEKLGLCDGPT